MCAAAWCSSSSLPLFRLPASTAIVSNILLYQSFVTKQCSLHSLFLGILKKRQSGTVILNRYVGSI
jgi:hypothetical protein